MIDGPPIGVGDERFSPNCYAFTHEGGGKGELFFVAALARAWRGGGLGPEIGVTATVLRGYVTRRDGIGDASFRALPGHSFEVPEGANAKEAAGFLAVSAFGCFERFVGQALRFRNRRPRIFWNEIRDCAQRYLSLGRAKCQPRPVRWPAEPFSSQAMFPFPNSSLEHPNPAAAFRCSALEYR